METILITGGEKQDRENKVQLLVDKLSISRFDIHILTQETSIGIEEIRKIRKLLKLKPYSSCQAFIIFDFEKATLEAQNAFLKTLEEPPSNTYIILTAANEDLLLPTIVSRSKIIKLIPSTAESPNNQSKLIAALIHLPHQSIGEKILLAQKYGSKKEEVLAFLLDSIHILRIQLKLCYPNTPANKTPPLFLLNLLKKFIKAREFIEKNTNPRLTLEVLFIGLTP